MAVSLKQLVQTRGQIKAHLTRFRTFIDAFNREQGSISLEARLKKLEPFFERFDEVQAQIENQITDEDEVAAAHQEREQFEASYFELVTRARTIIQEGTGQAQERQSVQEEVINVRNEQHIGVKLPVIKLPQFDGSTERWIKFRDTFQSMIDDNRTLTNIQKFHYLESAITGDAARTIEALGISEANYTIAWATLKERFEDQKALSHYHVRGLFELPLMVKDSHTSLRQLIDQAQNHLLALKNLGEGVEHWDSLMVYLLCTKLDTYSKREWEKKALQLAEKPKFKDIMEFLNAHCRYLERNDVNKQDATNKSKETPSTKTSKLRTNKLSTHVAQKVSCPICKNSHNIYQCEEFLKFPTQSKISEVQKHQLCFNCLRPHHQSKDCTSGHCKKCSKRHNTLLHREESSSESLGGTKTITDLALKENVNQNVACNHTHWMETPVILATAIISVQDARGNMRECRALLDGGSQSHFITQDLCDQLNLKLMPIKQPVAGLGNQQTNLNSKTELRFKSKYNAYGARITCLVIKRITGNMPNVSIDLSSLNMPTNLTLADPQFYQSRKIDLLIGAEHFWDILCIGQISLGPSYPIMQKTKLGWIVSGPIARLSKENPSKKYCHTITTQQLHNQVARFWELEECSSSVKMKGEDSICEDHFCATTTRSETGKFIVNIPFRENLQALGQSRERAQRRLLAIERKLHSDSSLSEAYRNFMDEYEVSGHMSRISKAISSVEETAHYLPHHAVRKESSTTTKLRVVFDGSAKTTSGFSINDVQYVGPVVQDDLWSILLRFRKHKVVISADVKQMYRQVLINEEQRKFQRILWRNENATEIEEYQLNTLTYGMASAPYLATRCLQQIAKEHITDYPIASNAIWHDFYMDDFLSGAESVQEAQDLKQTVSELLRDYGFELRKWASNHGEIVHSNTNGTRQLPVHEERDPKTLGLLWDPERDLLSFTINSRKPSHITKRMILSAIACIFDPLGLIVPIVVKAKLILQRLWQLKLGWDEALPQELHTKWWQFQNQLDVLDQIKIPRNAFKGIQGAVQLHGFSDASETAYGACIYVRVQRGQDTVEASLLCAKSRVAPLKTLTIPRLELCGALLLARLMQRVSIALAIDKEHQYFWCDSTIVLCYISAEPSKWTTFVANRTAEIQEITNKNWRHVPTSENPADLASRGATVAELLTSTLWWNGPHWLQKEAQSWPKLADPVITDIPDKKKKAVTSLVLTNLSEEFGQRFSSFTHMCRVLAYILRFKENTRKQQDFRNYGPLSVMELRVSEERLIKLAQYQDFNLEIVSLQNAHSVPKKSPIISLQPFLDEMGCLRVGGRIRNASIPFEQRHPLIISHRNVLARRIVEQEHIRLLHAGPQLTQASLRTKYWITSGRSYIKKILRGCIKCFRTNPVPSSYRMGDLPKARITPARPFFVSGVDYAGPFYIREKIRSKTVTKSYLCIFVCFVTKAVHFELATDMSTKAFLNCLSRFIARRGKCQAIHSDNGTNFIGAANELAELGVLLKSKAHQDQIQEFLSQDKIEWYNIPPHAPNFGGLWESAVRSAKYHLKRVFNNLPLTYEELYTVLTQIEAILNSRPLSPLSSDPKDLIPLTPAHFLIGDSLIALPQPDFKDINCNRLTRYERLQQMVQQFWRRWNVEYLHQLQTRSKWLTQPSRAIEPGMMIILKEDHTPPMQWKLGRIEAVHPGKDQIVRVVTVKTATGSCKRPLSQICPLPIEESNNKPSI